MERVARSHVGFGLLLAIAGMLLGIRMAATHDHAQHVTHAHLLLLGLVVSLLYAMVYRLWVSDGPEWIGWVQWSLHHAGTVALVIGLFLLYGGHVEPAALEPLLGAASVAVLLGMVAMLGIFLRIATRRGHKAAPTRAVEPSSAPGG